MRCGSENVWLLKKLKQNLLTQILSFQKKVYISFTSSLLRFSYGNVLELWKCSWITCCTGNYRLFKRTFCSKRSHWWLPVLLMECSSSCSVVSSINQESESRSLKQWAGKVNSYKSLCLGEKSYISLSCERIKKKAKRAFSGSVVRMEIFHDSTSTRWECGRSSSWCGGEFSLRQLKVAGSVVCSQEKCHASGTSQERNYYW